MTIYIKSIQVGSPRELPGETSEKNWFSAIFKQNADHKLWLNKQNLEGDEQADKKNHGGTDKAVLAYSWEHYEFWQQLFQVSSLPAAAFGENLTLTVLTEKDVCIGDIYGIGSVEVQVSQPRQPCWKQERRLQRPGLIKEMIAFNRTGWYLRVLKEGFLETGQAVTLLQRPYPQWTVETANGIMYGIIPDQALCSQLACCPLLSESWQQTLQKKTEQHS